MQIIAIQGDSLKLLNLKSDSSLLLASELQARNYKIFWYELHTLTYYNSNLYADGYYINVIYDEIHYYLKYEIISKIEKIKLNDVSCIMLRQNPPFDMHYITATLLLSLIANSKIFFMNDPAVLRNNIEKLLPLKYPQHIPETIISRSQSEIEDFLEKNNTIVLKPLYSFGGNDVIKIKKDGDSKQDIEKYLQTNHHVIAQEFIKEIYSGDKRVIVCDGEIMGYVGRIPEKDNFLTNSYAGGSTQKINLSKNEKDICNEIAISLKKIGIFLAGIDLLAEKVIEINITSPTLLVAINKENGEQIHKKIVDKIEENL